VIPYDVIITSVHDRADLLDRTLRSMLVHIDQRPARIIVHEDARTSHPVVEGRTEALLAAIERKHSVPIVLIATRPGGGLSRAMLRVLESASTEFVLYTQEDFDFVRPVPVARCLEIMQRHALTHVRFNKRDTLPIKGAHRPNRAEWWTKEEVVFDGQKLCVSDHVYFQANITRRALWLEGFKELLLRSPDGVPRCEARFNDWFNRKYGDGAGSVDGCQDKRRDRLRTFIWGGIGEPRFILHTGAERRSQGWGDPEHDRKHGTVGGEKR
jgi:hypothetical protein